MYIYIYMAHGGQHGLMDLVKLFQSISTGSHLCHRILTAQVDSEFRGGLCWAFKRSLRNRAVCLSPASSERKCTRPVRQQLWQKPALSLVVSVDASFLLRGLATIINATLNLLAANGPKRRSAGSQKPCGITPRRRWKPRRTDNGRPALGPALLPPATTSDG